MTAHVFLGVPWRHVGYMLGGHPWIHIAAGAHLGGPRWHW